MVIPEPTDTRAKVRSARAMDLAVDLGFAVLLIVCSLRYFSYHPWDSQGVAVSLLAAGSGLAYAAASFFGSSPKTQGLQRAGILLALGLWLPLVVLAPSYGWCAFALFVAVYRVLRGHAALAASALIVASVSVGLLLMSRGEDLGLVLGPFFGGFVLSLAYRGLHRSLEDGQNLIDQLVSTRAQLAQTEREAGTLVERNRLAGELHDTVVQRTASALLLLESAEQLGHSTPQVAEARELLRESLTETRQLMHGLTKPETADQSFVAQVSALGEKYSAPAAVTVAVVGEWRPIPEATAHVLLRVAQEALINAQKHAEAGSVSVTVTFFPESIGVDVADDGIGFDLSANSATEQDRRHDGYGLRAMAWRVGNVGGELNIESTPGRGTVVAAVIPDQHHRDTEGM